MCALDYQVEAAGGTHRIQIARLGGNCPVEAEGVIDGIEFYFRARGSRWSMGIGGKDVIVSPGWYHEEPYGEKFEAGWITEDQAISFINKAVGLWAAQQAEEVPAA